MKILTISDLHGRSVWENIDFDSYDHIIFLGDYTDSYTFDDETIFNNLSAIIDLKSQQPDRFTLLIGNHDAQYMHFPQYGCSGFRIWAQPALTELFNQNKGLFQIAHQRGAYLFVHAGVTNKWLKRLIEKTEHEATVVTPEFDLAGLLNDVHQQSARFRNLLFEVGPKRGGTHPHSGPVWADRSETMADYLQGFHQVVGHTPVDDFTTVGNKTGSITYTDVLQTKTAFYELTIPD